MARVTTHVLDTAAGIPAVGVRVVFRCLDGETQAPVEAMTNADGRLDAPLMDGTDFGPGRYQIEFHAGDYFRGRGVTLPDPPFVDVVPIRFGIADEAHYHVPLLVSPYGYSTYRGS